MAGKQKKKRKPQAPLTIKAVKAKGYSKSYENRIINAIRKARKAGKKPTRQAARGHKPQEHIVRKERERETLGGLTAREIDVITRWHSSTFNPKDYREVPTEEELIEWAQEVGYARFVQYRKVWDAARRTYVGEIKGGTWESRGMGYLYQLQGSARVDDHRWMYYH